MSRLDIKTTSRAQTVVDNLYRDVERRIAASPPGLCPVDMSLSFLQLCHAQTCGKCVPCRIGLGQLTKLISKVLDGAATMETIDIIEKTARSIVNTADCAIGRDAAVIFGATGGVMDAALRSAYYLVTGKNPDPDAFTAVRGMDGWEEAVFSIPGAGDVRVAVVSGLGNTRKLMNAIDAGTVDYDFVEVMVCPGGCAGGGQPIHDGVEMAESRGDVLWNLDKNDKLRFSHENSDVLALYHEYLKEPLGERSHHLLHTDHFGWKMPNEK